MLPRNHEEWTQQYCWWFESYFFGDRISSLSNSQENLDQTCPCWDVFSTKIRRFCSFLSRIPGRNIWIRKNDFKAFCAKTGDKDHKHPRKDKLNMVWKMHLFQNMALLSMLNFKGGSWHCGSPGACSRAHALAEECCGGSCEVMELISDQISSIQKGGLFRHMVDGFRNPTNTSWGTGSLSHYLQGFIHPRWCRIYSINSSSLFLRPFLRITCAPMLGLSLYSIGWDMALG